MTSICNYWLIITFHKGKAQLCLQDHHPQLLVYVKDTAFNIHFITLLITFSQLLTKLLEKVINKSTRQFKTLHVFSFIQHHTHLQFLFFKLEVEADAHWDLIYHPKAAEEGCPRSSSASSSPTQTLHTPALCTPACISTNFQVLSNSSSCTSTTVFFPLLQF